mmetsp:Transcript_98852/g.148087  ORF Transcript_98852/g.148087 Transcript_98852/m.148087 type:complete len:280 (+) Transcript_98852:371-1210(+)
MAARESSMALISALSLPRKPASLASCSWNFACSASRFLKSFSTPWRCFLLSSVPSAACVGMPWSSKVLYLSVSALNISDGATALTSHFSSSFLALFSLFSTFFFAASAAAAILVARSRASTSGSSSFQRKPSGLSSRRTPRSGSASSRTESQSSRYSLFAPCDWAVFFILLVHASNASSTAGSSAALLLILDRSSARSPDSKSETFAWNQPGSWLERAAWRTSSRKPQKASSTSERSSWSPPPPVEEAKGYSVALSSMPSVRNVLAMYIAALCTSKLFV